MSLLLNDIYLIENNFELSVYKGRIIMSVEQIELMYSLMVFVIGTLFGSFFSLATYRIPRKQDIWIKRSYCPKCKHNLGFFDCFPIFSYISTVGRCKYCKCYISYRYPILEIVNGFVFLFIYLFLGFSMQFFVIIACYIYLFLVIGSDIMESKMTEKEKKEVQKIIEERKKEKQIKKKDKKKGAINIEIAVAITVFLIYFATTVYVTANYRGTLEEYKIKSDALNICINKAEEVRSKSFDDLTSGSGRITADGVDYDYTVTTNIYMKDGYEQISYAKEINIDVKYTYKGDNKIISVSIIKEADEYER